MDFTLSELHLKAFPDRQAQLLVNNTKDQRSLKDLGFGTFDSNDMNTFFKIDRNYLVMTTAGKPVFAL